MACLKRNQKKKPHTQKTKLKKTNKKTKTILSKTMTNAFILEK